MPVAEFTRLPKHTIPLHYDLSIFPNLNDFTNTGNIQIQLKIDKQKLTSNIIRIHACEIEIKKALLNDTPFQSVSYCEDNEEAHLTFGQNLEEFLSEILTEKDDDNLLSIEYSSTINNKLKGFYRSKFVNRQGKEDYIATTHFEPTGSDFFWRF